MIDDDVDDPQSLHIPKGTPLFQISEDDLAVLEQVIPQLMWANPMGCNDTATRMKWRRVKGILSSVRWRGGPPAEVERIPVDKED